MSAPVSPIEGSWWFDDGQDSGVWPCEVLGESAFGVRIRGTHANAPHYNEIITVAHNRVHDSGFNQVRDALKVQS